MISSLLLIVAFFMFMNILKSQQAALNYYKLKCHNYHNNQPKSLDIPIQTPKTDNNFKPCFNVDVSLNSCCNPSPCPPITPCYQGGPSCARSLFTEDFINFTEKVNSNVWTIFTITDPAVTANDGTIVQECDGVTLESKIYTIARPHHHTQYHLAYQRDLPYNINYKGISVETTFSHNTKYVSRILLDTTFGPFYEGSGLDPDDDFRLASSNIEIMSILDDETGIDLFYAAIVSTRKKVYLLYGVLELSDSSPVQRDRFVAAIPIADRTGSMDEVLIFNLVVNYDGSILVYSRGSKSCAYQCLLTVNNIAVPPAQKNYVVAYYSRAWAAAKTLNPLSNPPITFLYEPTTLTNLKVVVGNFSDMALMEPLSQSFPQTTLYSVLNDYNNQVMRVLCDCDNTFALSETMITLPDGTTASTAILNYGQGSSIKLYNMIACYV
jgi:hypothetical protein